MKEIKKVNSLEELNQLELGDKIQARKPSELDDVVYEGKIDGKYSFMEAFINKFNLIQSRRYNEKDIRFMNGFLMSNIYESKIYHPGDEGYTEKLNLIQGEK